MKELYKYLTNEFFACNNGNTCVIHICNNNNSLFGKLSIDQQKYTFICNKLKNKNYVHEKKNVAKFRNDFMITHTTNNNVEFYRENILVGEHNENFIFTVIEKTTIKSVEFPIINKYTEEFYKESFVYDFDVAKLVLEKQNNNFFVSLVFSIDKNYKNEIYDDVGKILRIIA